MDIEESILDTLNEDGIFEDDDDVEMADVEEGELLEHIPSEDLGKSNNTLDDANNVTNPKPQSRNQKRRANKKKNKNRRKSGGPPGPNVTDINRFVLETCRRLKEKKSYMVYTAVGCLGVSALYDLVNEVEAVQACGGQMTADGRRSRTAGGILWNIIKAQEPKAYKEIVKKTQEFEKQFKRPNFKPATKGKDGSSLSVVNASNEAMPRVSDDLRVTSEAETQKEMSNDEEKRAPVRERLRVPVSYDDELLVDDLKDLDA